MKYALLKIRRGHYSKNNKRAHVSHGVRPNNFEREILHATLYRIINHSGHG